MESTGTSTLRSFDEFYKDLGSAPHARFEERAEKQVVGVDEFERQREHLLNLYKDVHAEHSFVDSAGQIFDCIPTNEQPALKGSGKSVATPPDISQELWQPSGEGRDMLFLGSSQADKFGNPMACPEGTVPIRRVTLEEISRFDTLEDFFGKSPRHSPHRTPLLLNIPVPPEVTDSAHDYAIGFQQVPNIGGHSILNIWQPPCEGAQVSLSQQWYVAPGPWGRQTAEVGWQVYPQKYGHNRPVFFVYWTATDYNGTGSYNYDRGEFVQYSPACPVGLALPNVSAPGGPQGEIEVAFLLIQANWWLFVNGSDAAHAVGYYTTSLYRGGPMTVGAAEIVYGGETSANGSFPPMGSGEFAAAGFQHAAYQRDIGYFVQGGGSQVAGLLPGQLSPAQYTVAIGNAGNWGEYIYFGGPG